MGKIQDKYDVEDLDIKKLNENIYLVKGIISIEELNDQLGHIPTEGEKCLIEYNGLVFEIEEVKGKRIETVKISRVK